MIRAFIAGELGAELRAALAEAQASLKDTLLRDLRRQAPDARLQWVRPESLHVTLKFLGPVGEDRIPDLERAMTLVAGAHSRFSLEVGGLGVFPDSRQPRILWVGMSGSVQRLAELAGELDLRLEGMGFSRETKPFRVHLTLARIKEQAREIGKVLTAAGLSSQAGQPGQVAKVGTLEVSALSLMKSDLKPTGAVYTRLAEIPLASPA